MLYISKAELIKKLQSEIPAKVRRKLSWEPPYDDSDYREVKAAILGRGKNIEQIRRIKSTRVKLGHNREGTGRGGDMGCGLFGGVMRESLGFSSPIPINKLEEELELLKSSLEKRTGTKTNWISVEYPDKDYIEGVHKGLHIWSTNYIDFPDVFSYIKIEKLRFHTSDIISQMAKFTKWHPSLVFACLLCDLQVHKHIVDAIIDPLTNRIAIYANGTDVSIDMTSTMYKYARYFLLMLGNDHVATVPRPRSATEKISALLHFVQTNRALKWKKICIKWNADYPKWKYSNMNSMQVVYYRAILKSGYKSKRASKRRKINES